MGGAAAGARKLPRAAGVPEGPSRVQHLATFAAYEEAWSCFETQAAGGSQVLGCADIPWPLDLPTVSGAADHDSGPERKRKLRTALLRWHPDKWAPLLGRIRDVDKAEVTERVKEVTRRILAEKERFS